MTEGHMMFPYGLYVFSDQKSNAVFAVTHNLKERLGEKQTNKKNHLVVDAMVS